MCGFYLIMTATLPAAIKIVTAKKNIRLTTASAATM
jgi:hypothetical protein